MTADQSPSRGVTGSHLPFGGDGQDVPDPTPVPALSERALRAASAVLTASGAVKVPNTKVGQRLCEAYDELDVLLQVMGIREPDPSDPVNYRRVQELLHAT